MTTEDTGGLSRRQILQRAAVVGTTAWVAPMIVSTKAHAAGTLGGNICPRPSAILYRYTGGPWKWDVCSDPNENPSSMPDTRNPLSDPLSFAQKQCVDLTVSGPTSQSWTGLAPGQTFNITNIGSGNPNIVFTVRPCGQNSPVGTLTVHVSCSQPICIGDTHGYFQIIGATPK